MADVAASAQAAITQVLAAKAVQAARQTNLNTLVLAGGVAANLALRQEIKNQAPDLNLLYPSLVYCTDNAAMIGAVALHKFAQGDFADYTLNAQANLPLYYTENE